MRKLEAGEPPDTAKNRPHWLVGYSPRAMECHIGGDWLLLYRCSGSDIYYIRTGTHSDLFR
jgi:mRNA interferase YafQ